MNEDEIIKFSELTQFFPKQSEALSASKRFKFVLFGGSVGSGKSYWLRWTCLYWLIKYHAKYGIRGIRAGLFCEDYPSLNDRHLTKVKFEFPKWLGTWNEQKKEFTLAPEYGSGILAFRNLDEPEKYLSVEFATIAIDEINRNPKTTFDMLRSRHRWPGIKDVKFLCGCNPLGEAWVKNMWVKRIFPPNEKEQYEFVFVPALPTDNPHLPIEYYKSLESLPDNQRKAYLEGNWDAFDEGVDEKGYIRLVNDRELQASLTAETEHSGYVIGGIDPAAGGDNSAIVIKSAHLMEVVFNQKLQNTMDLVSRVVDINREHKVDFWVVDKTGVGQGVYDRMKEMDYPIKGVSFGEKSEDPQYANLKAEWHFKLRKWIVGGGKLKQDYGWNELEVIRYKHKDSKIIIQPKEELFRDGISSPNVVDAAVLTMVMEDNAIKSARIIKQRYGREFHDHTQTIWRNE